MSVIAARDEEETLSHRLQQTLERIGDGFLLLSDNWRISFLNHKAATLLQRGRDELLDQVVWDQFPEAAGSTFQTEYEHAIELGERVRFQQYFPPLETWFEVDAHPTPEGLAVYFRDITQERQRTEQLRLLEAAVSRQNDILLITEAGPVTGPEGPKIVYVNDAFVNCTGYSRAEAIGQTPRILQGPNTQRDELHRIRTALEKWQPVRAELINYTKQGEEFWMELDIVPLADEAGQYTHWVAILRDITDRKRAESQIRLNETRFRLLAKATNDVVWDWSLTQNAIWWNESLTSHFGYDFEKMEGGSEFWANYIHPEDRARVSESVESVINGAANNWSCEYRFLHADGHPVAVVGRGFVIRDSNGKSIRMLGSMTDVTHQRDMEAKLRQSQKLEAVGRLTGGIAHDFNNILTIILGNSEILYEELGDQRELCLLAEMIATSAERGAELTSRLLAFARKQALEPSLLDVNALIGGMESLLRRTLGAEIEIEVIRARGLWSIEVDASQLENAILNLAINARDAMENGGCLTVETANAKLDCDYVAAPHDVIAGEYTVITITDTGHGIQHDTLDRVFEPFYTTKELGQGSGLGLSMVYGFVKQSGGHIRLQSEPGEGTSVTLYFPRSHREGDPKPASRLRTRAVGGDESILVVEDDRLVSKHLTSQLEGLGYRITVANSGVQALEMLQAMPDIDLLFTDVVMPGRLSGEQLARRALSLRPGLKVLFTSGITKNATVGNGKLKLNADFLRKPYRRHQLAAKIRKVLEQ